MNSTKAISQEVSPKTVEMLLKAIKLSNQHTQSLKSKQRHREQTLVLIAVFLAILNAATLMLANFAPNEGLANAVNDNERQLDTVLNDLKAVTQESIHDSAVAKNMEPAEELSKQPFVSKIVPLPENPQSLATYYGENLAVEEVERAENLGQAPHSNNIGAPLGAPAPPRSKRIEELLRNRIPLTTQETLYIKKLVDDNERATYATPDVEQRTVKLQYEEGLIPTITVARNNIATLSFVDQFGNPFPISTLSPKGAGELFTTELINHDGTHANVAEIRASKLNGSSNVSVMLVGRTLPAVFKVNLSHAVNDATTVVQLDSSAPGYEHVSLPASTAGLQLCSQDAYMEPLLDGVVAAELVRLETRVAKLQAYRSPSHHYIRSAHQIVDPECTCRIYGVDNLNVCKQPISISSILYVDSATHEFASVALNREA